MHTGTIASLARSLTCSASVTQQGQAWCSGTPMARSCGTSLSPSGKIRTWPGVMSLSTHPISPRQSSGRHLGTMTSTRRTCLTRWRYGCYLLSMRGSCIDVQHEAPGGIHSTPQAQSALKQALFCINTPVWQLSRACRQQAGHLAALRRQWMHISE